MDLLQHGVAKGDLMWTVERRGHRSWELRDIKPLGSLNRWSACYEQQPWAALKCVQITDLPKSWVGGSIPRLDGARC